MANSATDDQEATMATRRVPKVTVVTDDSWFKKQITVGNMVSVGTMAFGFAGFYFNTSATLTAQANAISTIERKIGEAEKKDEKQQAAVIAERTTLRAEMTQRAEKTAEGIAELNKQTAVLSTQLTTINAELVKIGEQLRLQQQSLRK
jgi:hypothetical protein